MVILIDGVAAVPFGTLTCVNLCVRAGTLRLEWR